MSLIRQILGSIRSSVEVPPDLGMLFDQPSRSKFTGQNTLSQKGKRKRARQMRSRGIKK